MTCILAPTCIQPLQILSLILCMCFFVSFSFSFFNVMHKLYFQIIRVSTAEPVKEVKDFTAEEFKNAINLIKRYENDVRRMRKMVSEDHSGKHHLEYEFHSMSEKGKQNNYFS